MKYEHVATFAVGTVLGAVIVLSVVSFDASVQAYRSAANAYDAAADATQQRDVANEQKEQLTNLARTEIKDRDDKIAELEAALVVAETDIREFNAANQAASSEQTPDDEES